MNAFPYIGMYHASKWALEGLSQSLAQEVGPLGIRVTLIEPVGYTTDWSRPSAKYAEKLPAYDGAGGYSGPSRCVPARRPSGDRTGHAEAGGHGGTAAARLLRPGRE